VPNVVAPPTQAPPAALSSPLARSRRWWRWVVVAITAIVVSALGIASAMVANYQPIIPGGLRWPAPTGVAARVVPQTWLGAPSGARVFRIPARKGLTFTYRYHVYNQGSVPITVTSIGLPTSAQRGEGLTREVARVRVDRWEAEAPPLGGGRWVPFQPFTLQGRQGVSVQEKVIVQSALGCEVRWNTQWFSFKVFGLHRSDLVTLPVQINLVGSPNCQLQP
jgi:hypothetical protein